MLKQMLPIAIGFVFILSAGCQNSGGVKKINGLEYNIVRHNAKDTAKARVGDIIEANIEVLADSMKNGKSVTFTLADSRKENQNKPVPFRVNLKDSLGDFKNVLQFLTVNDSVVVRVAIDTIAKAYPNQPLPPFLKKGGFLTYKLSVVSVKSMADFQKEMQERQVEMQKQMEQQKTAQMPVDDKLIQDYLAKNNIKAEKTASGIYYVISKPGTGATVAPGKKVSVNYTGKTLDGKMFDSNTDPSKGHVKPFEFIAGKNMVIPGWDEGIKLLKKGSKATLFIPSALAYGPRGAGGDIGPNTVLMFDVEVLDIMDAGKDEAANQ
jgi:FKBP-type peptidyl-prolyl cis-trans isomerase FkpA